MGSIGGRLGRAWMVGVGLRALLASLLAAGLWSPGARAAAAPDFSGDWTADLKASDFGPVGSPDHLTMKVAHKEPEITIHYDLGMGGTPVVWDATCKTDGKECKSTNGNVTLSLQWQGESLIMNRSMSVAGFALKLKDAWSLSADGKTLTSTRDLNTDQGSATQKIVFTKS